MVQKGNLNEGCLQALTACCRELGRFEDIVTLYDAHLKLQPQNEELACSVGFHLSSIALCTLDLLMRFDIGL